MSRSLGDFLDELVPGKATSGLLARAFRKRMGLTQDELSEVTGIERTNISAIENDRIEMTKHYAEILGAALGLHPNELLYPEGDYKMNRRALEVQKKTKALLKKKKVG